MDKMHTPFSDLKMAIIAVLTSATYPCCEYEEATENTSNMLVDVQALRSLQAEYNIYFVEPDAPQADII